MPSWHNTNRGTGVFASLSSNWHAIRPEKRLAALGSTCVMLIGILSSLTFAGASTTAGTVVSFEVTTATGFLINVVAIPEKRTPTTGNNGTILTVEVRDPGSSTPLISQTVTTGSGGTYSGMNIALTPGTYDIAAKGFSHLRVKRTGLSLAQNTTVDFTAGGTSPLLCGDVNGLSGDNKVNGIDLTQIVSGLATYDVRYDLNRDGRVNGIDLTNAVSNLNQVGAS